MPTIELIRQTSYNRGINNTFGSKGGIYSPVSKSYKYGPNSGSHTHRLNPDRQTPVHNRKGTGMGAKVAADTAVPQYVPSVPLADDAVGQLI